MTRMIFKVSFALFVILQNWTRCSGQINASQGNNVSLENSCQLAMMQCKYRTGCGNTLQSYIFECSDLIHNMTEICTDRCKNTLVGLTSTPEGKKLMECSCGTDEECRTTRDKIFSSCQESVLNATRNDFSVVSCTEAEWICKSDAECGKALEYYNIYCQAMFRGKFCTFRCKNSLSILKRQRQAKKLETCQCKTDEYFYEFKCQDVKRYMEQLCFDSEDAEDEADIDDDNDVETDKEISDDKSCSSSRFPLSVFLVTIIQAVISFY